MLKTGGLGMEDVGGCGEIEGVGESVAGMNIFVLNLLWRIKKAGNVRLYLVPCWIWVILKKYGYVFLLQFLHPLDPLLPQLAQPFLPHLLQAFTG